MTEHLRSRWADLVLTRNLRAAHTSGMTTNAKLQTIESLSPMKRDMAYDIISNADLPIEEDSAIRKARHDFDSEGLAWGLAMSLAKIRGCSVEEADYALIPQWARDARDAATDRNLGAHTGVISTDTESSTPYIAVVKNGSSGGESSIHAADPATAQKLNNAPYSGYRYQDFYKALCGQNYMSPVRGADNGLKPFAEIHLGQCQRCMKLLAKNATPAKGLMPPLSFSAAQLPAFHVVGDDDHPLGKRSLWLNEDGSGEMLSEAFGMRSVTKFKPGEGHAALKEITKAYADHEASPFS